MPLFQRNQPNHSLLLMPVKLAGERLEGNRRRVLLCDSRGKLFTRIIDASTWRKVSVETKRMEESHRNYASVFWDQGLNQYQPLVIPVGEREVWALERILEHALKNKLVPDTLKNYPARIIGMVSEDQIRSAANPARTNGKKAPVGSEKEYNAAPPSPIAPDPEFVFPFLILEKLPVNGNEPANLQPVLVLDSQGKAAEIVLPADDVRKAEINRDALTSRGKDASLVCLKDAAGILVDFVQLTRLQKQALDGLAREYLGNIPLTHQLTAPVRQALNKARKAVSG